MKFHFTHNGRKHGWGTIRSVVDFFFPRKWHPLKKGDEFLVQVERCEAATCFGRKSPEHHFFTFRAFVVFYWKEFLGKVKELGSVELRVVEMVLAPGLSMPAGFYFAVARDANAVGNFAVPPVNFAHVCTGSNLMLLVYVWTNQTTDPTITATYNSVSMTAVNAGVTDGTSDFVKMLYLKGPATGSNTVSVSATHSVTGLSVSYSGVAQAVPEANNTGSANPGTTITDTLTTIASNAWMVAGISSDSGLAFSAGTGASLVVQSGANNTAFFDSNGGLSPGSNSMTMTCSSQRIQTVFVSIAPFATTVTPKRTLVGVGT